ncbi:MAG TPA: protein translocase subunit SecD, partial [Pseudomonadales bacterium]|nr:protein translocase subunit SecD [Pseudomonadales bacterium]
MLNTYPWWKNLIVVVILIAGVFYALPNIFPPDFAIQISTESSDGVVTQEALETSEKALTDAGLKFKGGGISGGNALVRVYDAETQLKAKKVIEFALQGLKKHYVVALNSAPTTPQWLRDIGAQPMKYGLDLRGGIHFLLQVDTDGAIKAHVKQLQSDIKRSLREDKLRYHSVEIEADGLKISFEEEGVRAKALDALKQKYNEFKFTEGKDDLFFITAQMTQSAIQEIQTFAVSQNVQTIRNRVNELGVAEPLVQRLGANRIVVDLPGVQDTTEAKRILGKVATLEFRMEAQPDAPSSSTLSYDYEGRKVELERDMIISGDRVIDAQVGYDRNSGLPEVDITLDSTGGEKMNRATRHNVGRRMGVVFIETKTRNKIEMVDGEKTLVPEPYTTKRIISLATVQSALSVKFRITGLDAPEARELSLLLRAGALAAD